MTTWWIKQKDRSSTVRCPITLEIPHCNEIFRGRYDDGDQNHIMTYIWQQSKYVARNVGGVSVYCAYALIDSASGANCNGQINARFITCTIDKHDSLTQVSPFWSSKILVMTSVNTLRTSHFVFNDASWKTGGRNHVSPVLNHQRGCFLNANHVTCTY